MDVHRTFARMPFTDTGLEGSLHEVIAVRETWPDGYAERAKSLSWLVVVVNEQGESRHTEEGKSVLAPEGAVVVQPRGIVCADSSPGPWTNSYILAEGPLVDVFEAGFWATQPPSTEVYPQPARTLVDRLRKAADTVFAQPVGHPWEVLGSVVELLHALLESPPPSRPEHDLLSRARRLVEADVSNPWPVVELAAALGAHPKALARWFDRYVGESPKAWVRRQRMELAQGMLRRGLSVSGAAELLGFADISAFSRQFRTVVGQAPSALVIAPPTRVPLPRVSPGSASGSSGDPAT